MKLFASVLSLLIFFTGCGEKTIKEQKLECEKQGKKFTTKKVLNHREGKYVVKGECK